MKTRLLFLLLLFSSFQFLQGKIWTVDNKPNSSANFTDLQTAIDSASAGDTLMVAGSHDRYGEYTGINITKKLAILGAGYKVNNQWGLTTKFGYVYFKPRLNQFGNITSMPNQSFISGIDLIHITIHEPVTNITIDRSYISGRLGIDNNTSVVVRNSIISGIDDSGGSSSDYEKIDVLLNNCIIRGHLNSLNPASNFLVDHCIFINESYSLLEDVSYAIISNSIFYGVSTGFAEYTTFSNNISFGGTTEFIYGTNTGGNNLVNVNPQFNRAEGFEFSFNDDYRLQPGSSAIGAASDGTDMGIYGGNFPFPIGGEGEYLMAAPPRIPQIMEMNIQNATVPENGTLKVVLKARKGN